MKTKLIAEYHEIWPHISKNAILFLTGSTFIGIGLNMYNLLFNLFLKQSSFNEAVIGIIRSNHALGSVLVAIPTSILLSHYAIKNLIILSTVFAGISYFLQTLFTQLVFLNLNVIISGAFSTIVTICAGPFLMRNSSDKERLYLFSLNGAISMGTGFIGSVLGGFFKDGINLFIQSPIIAYKITLIIGALSIISAAIPFSKITPIALQKKDENLSRISLKDINIPIYFKILLPSFIVGIGAGLTIPFINLYFKNVFSMSDSAIGLLFGFGQAFTFLGIIAGPILAKKHSKPKFIMLSQLLSIPFILILTYLKYVPVVIIAFFIRGTLMNMSSPISDNFALENVPINQHHIMNAVKMLTWTGSWMIAARISGKIILEKGFSFSFTITAILYLVSTFFFFIFFLNKKTKLHMK